MIDFGGLLDAAFDAVGMREPALLLTAPEPYPDFLVDFKQPQQVVMEGQAHTTMASIEYTTSAVRPLEEGDQVSIRGVVYRISTPPMFTHDGHWSVAELDPVT